MDRVSGDQEVLTSTMLQSEGRRQEQCTEGLDPVDEEDKESFEYGDVSPAHTTISHEPL